VSSPAPDRAPLVRRGLRLNYLTIGYNVVEALVSLVSGFLAGSVALVGFGIDSVIEVSASAAAQWRLRVDLDHARREHVELLTRRAIGISFLALALYVAIDSGKSLWLAERPDRSITGIVILTMSLIVMPVLARAKRRVARSLDSRALEADATQTSLCAWLSAIALAGVALNAALGWWWADPAAGLGIATLAAVEGVRTWRAESLTDTCCD
jgi:divalent metal cation (Fe/Co/Zn/Cd) transporter